MTEYLEEFKQNKLIFIHIPKCAGTSILNNFNIPQTGHLSLYHYIKLFGTLDEYFVFTFVRNPIDRFLSAFNYLSLGGRNKWDEEWKTKLNINKSNLKNIIFFLNEARGKNIEIPVHFRNQTSFLKKSKFQKFNKKNLNFIGRFEHIDNDFKELCLLSGMEYKRLQKINSKPKTNDLLNLNDIDRKEMKLLCNIYSKDFKNFNYPKLLA